MKKAILKRVHLRHDSGPQGEAVTSNDIIPMPPDPKVAQTTMTDLPSVLPTSDLVSCFVGGYVIY